MQYRSLGNTGIQVSCVGFGGWAIGGRQGKGFGVAQDDESLAALQSAYEQGCTFFDTANHFGYGHSETLIGKALKNWERERVSIATTAGFDFSSPNEEPRLVFSEAHLRRSCEASLQRLEVEAIDLYQLQTPTLELIQMGRMFEVMKDLKKEGKIRHYGIVIHDPQEGIQAIDYGQVETVQVAFNLFEQRPILPLFEHCQKNNIGLIIREPLAQGCLTGAFDSTRQFDTQDLRSIWPPFLLSRRIAAAQKFIPAIPDDSPDLASLALRYVLSQSPVSTVIPGCKTVKQTLANMAVGDLAPLDDAQLQLVKEIQKSL